jgi:hypothetical protein
MLNASSMYQMFPLHPIPRLFVKRASQASPARPYRQSMEQKFAQKNDHTPKHHFSLPEESISPQHQWARHIAADAGLQKQRQ